MPVDIKKHILIVDDEPGILKVLGLKFRLSGYDVNTTTSGAEAIELCRSGKPDILLLDILMPYVTGFDVLHEVRTFSSMPIIALTAARQDIVDSALEEGADDYVTKPFDPDRLVEKIGSILAKSA